MSILPSPFFDQDCRPLSDLGNLPAPAYFVIPSAQDWRNFSLRIVLNSGPLNDHD